MSDTAHRRSIRLAAAAWIELNGVCEAYQAAVLRGDVAGADELRRKAHDMLDNHLDLKGEAAVLVARIIGD